MLTMQRIVTACLLTVVVSCNALADDLGRERFMHDCAVCHGDDARGHGPRAAELERPPADLRGLRAHRGGFPAAELRALIDGRDLDSAHAGRNMPLWGEVYKRNLAGLGEREVQQKLDALVEYLESIQD